MPKGTVDMNFLGGGNVSINSEGGWAKVEGPDLGSQYLLRGQEQDFWEGGVVTQIPSLRE